MAQYPRSERARIWWRQEYLSSGKPWMKRMSGPFPFSAITVSIPPTKPRLLLGIIPYNWFAVVSIGGVMVVVVLVGAENVV
ncbi:hypothetical protein EV1_001393 [Malus domestica]